MDNTLLDDLVPADILASLKIKRAKKSRTDLSDLVGELPPKPPAIEVLSPLTVIFYVQENTCRCGAKSELPLGLVAMHACKRHGRNVSDRIGVALAEPNEFPELPRERDVQRSTSIVCSSCVDVARFSPRVSLSEYVSPRPNTEGWSEQFGYGSAPEIHEREERFRRTDERLARLEAMAEEKVLAAALESEFVQSEELEPTNPEDTK